MASNPLASFSQSNAVRMARPGDQLTINVKDKDGSITKTINIYRTNRPYAFDLCDAYNEARPQESRDRGVEWYVTDAGEVKLGFDRAHSYKANLND